MYKFTENSRVVFFGDSITHGGLWTRRVYDYYFHDAKIKCEMYNFGVSGNTAEKGYARIDRIYKFDPTDVVIMFGMNDVSYGSFSRLPLTEEKLKERRDYRDRNFSFYQKISKELSGKGINLIFCTPTVYDELSDIEEFNCIGALGAIKEYADRVQNLASKYGGNVVDFTSLSFEFQKRAFKKGLSLIRADRVHPTEAGHELMSRYFLHEQGFDVEYDLPIEELIEKSKAPFSPLEEKRHEYEIKAKSCDFTRFDYFWQEKDLDVIAEKAEKALLTHEASSWAKGSTLDYVEGCFRSFLQNYKNVEKYIDDYIAFVKSAKN